MVTEAGTLANSLSPASASLLLDSKMSSQCQKQPNRPDRSVRALNDPSSLWQTLIQKERRTLGIRTHGQASGGSLLMEDLRLGQSYLGFQHGLFQRAKPEGGQSLVPLEISK